MLGRGAQYDFYTEIQNLISGLADGFMLELGGKGAPVTTGVYFQDHF